MAFLILPWLDGDSVLRTRRVAGVRDESVGMDLRCVPCVEMTSVMGDE